MPRGRTGAGPVARRSDGGLLAQLIPQPRRPLSSEQLVGGLRDAGIVVLPDLPDSSTPYEVYRSTRGGFVDAVALASWLSEDERVVVLQGLRRQLLGLR
jgi:hypothetical protein